MPLHEAPLVHVILFIYPEGGFEGEAFTEIVARGSTADEAFLLALGHSRLFVDMDCTAKGFVLMPPPERHPGIYVMDQGTERRYTIDEEGTPTHITYTAPVGFV